LFSTKATPEKSQAANHTTSTPVNSGSNVVAMPHSKSAAESALVSPQPKPINHSPTKGNKMPKRKDQKDTLTNLADLQNDPGRARGEDY
jgi:hypothetical protein